MAALVRINNLRKSRLSNSPTLIIALVIFSFEFKISNDARWIIFLAYFILIVAQQVHRTLYIPWVKIVILTLPTLASFIYFNKSPDRAMQFLTYGYDNAFHFTQFRGFIETSWFPNVDVTSWFTDFQAFASGPLGYYAITSFLIHPLTLISAESEYLLILFATLQIFTIILLTKLIYDCINNSSFKSKKVKFFYGTFSLIIVFCLPATLLFNGFAPYVIDIALIFIWLNYDSNNQNKWQKNFTLSLAIYTTSVVTPAPTVFLFLSAFLIVFRECWIAIRNRQANLMLKNLSPFVFVGAFVFWTFSNSSAGYGWRQLLQPGGLQNINLFTSLIILATTVFLLMRTVNSKIDEDLQIILISGILSVIGLSLLTILLTGNLQYYAIKQIYVLLLFSIVYCVKIIKVNNLSMLLNSFLAALMLIPMFNPIFFEGGYMGVPPRVLNNTIQKDNWSTDPVNSILLLDFIGKSKMDENNCYIWRSEDPFTNKDLSSRWLNAMKSSNLISENCFSAYWNNGQLSDKDFIEKLISIDNNFVVLSEAPLSPEESQLIEYEKIP